MIAAGLLALVCVAGQAAPCASSSLRWQAYCLQLLDSMSLERRTDTLLADAQSQLQRGDTAEAARILETMVVGCEIDGGKQGFSSARILGNYTKALTLLERAYGWAGNCHARKYTMVKLSGLTDTKPISPCQDTVGTRAPDRITQMRHGKLAFGVRAGDTLAAALTTGAQPKPIVFQANGEQERTLVRLWFGRRSFVQSIKVTCDSSSDGAILRAWSDVRMDNVTVVRNGRAALGGIWVNKYLDIDVVFQDAPLTVRGIELQ